MLQSPSDDSLLSYQSPSRVPIFMTATMNCSTWWPPVLHHLCDLSDHPTSIAPSPPANAYNQDLFQWVALHINWLHEDSVKDQSLMRSVLVSLSFVFSLHLSCHLLPILMMVGILAPWRNKGLFFHSSSKSISKCRDCFVFSLVLAISSVNIVHLPTCPF